MTTTKPPFSSAGITLDQIQYMGELGEETDTDIEVTVRLRFGRELLDITKAEAREFIISLMVLAAVNRRTGGQTG